MTWFDATIVFVAALIASGIGTGLVLRALRRFEVLDRPNTRSSHVVPTPRGGGIAVILVIIAITFAINAAQGSIQDDTVLAAVAAILGLALVSWLDDLKGVSVLVRLAAQVVAVVGGLVVMGPDRLYFDGILPPVVDAVGAALLWVWFLNAFNFMDGIDGITGTEAAAIGLGIAAVAALAGFGPAYAALSLGVAGAALGFLAWNWPPAKVFMGDVGSVPLGFVLGGLLLDLAAQGFGAAALILPLYYLTDAAVTIAKRTWRGEPVWQAHRQHFYQQAVQRGFGHGSVVKAVALANLGLVGLAGTATLGYGWPAVGGAGIVVALLIAYLTFAPVPQRAVVTT
ncbi:MAG: glycosyltransferase family 4 protein [Rhodospirillales bacterium]|nr:glycosyltransferase family 4 protein [Rhodospirillales bacterium]